jgi:hypothetical protein
MMGAVEVAFAEKVGEVVFLPSAFRTMTAGAAWLR